MIHPVPKPPKREPKPKRFLPRSTHPIQKVNVKRKTKRQQEYRAHLASAEYKHARKEALWRAEHRCEYREPTKSAAHVFLTDRCTATAELQAHHLRYPKTRLLEAKDLLILCKHHHALVELRDHAHRQHGR